MYGGRNVPPRTLLQAPVAPSIRRGVRQFNRRSLVATNCNDYNSANQRLPKKYAAYLIFPLLFCTVIFEVVPYPRRLPSTVFGVAEKLRSLSLNDEVSTT